MTSSGEDSPSDEDFFEDVQPATNARQQSTALPPSSSDLTSRTQTRHPCDTTNVSNITSWNGPTGWSVYFPDELESDESCTGRAKVTKRLKDYFISEQGQLRLAAVSSETFNFPLDFQHLSHRSSPTVLRNIAGALEGNPDEALSCIGLAACRAAEELSSSQGVAKFAGAEELPVSREYRLWPRIYNFSPITSMRSLRGNSVGKFVSFRGTVVRVSNIRQQLVSMEFECGRCGERQLRAFVDYKFSHPESCPTEKCRGRNFQPVRDTAETVDWQKIRIQEVQEKDDDGSFREEGRMPRTIDAELFAELIDTCIPGDIVTACGTVRVLTIDGNTGFSKGSKCLYYMYLEANSVRSSRNVSPSALGASSSISRHIEESETLAIHRVIREVVREKDPFGFLVHSAVPSIYGHELVKAGMLLSLFGGAPKERIGPSGSESVAIRRDIHCLVVGDPGLGKSQMLKAFANIAPRGVYVCGNSTTTAGLTVTVVREASGDFALEAGALVLGDRGVCCIDEFDKMRAEHGALLEAMEQQSVSVAKAGLMCNLSARTTVLAAANPAGGHYDRSLTVCENLKIGLPLLSRFDLVFILMDKADAARDRFISEHVMNMFGMRNSGRASGTGWRRDDSVRGGSAANGSDGGIEVGSQDDEKSLMTRLREMKVRDPLPPSLFRQYVSYARTHVAPELSEGAKRQLMEFYLHLRKTAQEQAADTTPITTRQLESLIRLSEARARAVMRTVVTAQDAKEVIEIMRESMIETLSDETGTVDLGRASGMSRHKEAKRFIAAVNAEAKRKRTALFDRSSLRGVAERIGIVGERFERVVETVNHQGYLIKKGGRKWELVGCSFSIGGGQGQCGSRTQGPSRRTQRQGSQSRHTHGVSQGLSQFSVDRRRRDAMRGGESSEEFHSSDEHRS